LFNEVTQIARRRRARGLADADVVFRAQATFEAVDDLTEHASDDPGLALVELIAAALIKMGFGHVEVDPFDGVGLRLKDRLGEISHPASDFEILVVALKRSVIILAS